MLGYKVLEVNTSSFLVETRKRTAEELESIKNKWDEEGHLLSGDAYVNRIKDDMVHTFNKDYPSNVVNYIRDNIGKYDFILVNDCKNTMHLLHDEGIKICKVHPDPSLLEAYVGRMFLNGYDDYAIKKRIENWEEDTALNNEVYSNFVLGEEKFDAGYLGRVYASCLEVGCVNALEDPDKEESLERI